MTSNDIYKIIFPKNVRLPDVCSFNGDSNKCITFPGNRWVVAFPGATQSGAGKSMAIGIHNAWYVNGGDLPDHDYTW